MERVSVGDLVLSLAGRDKGEYLVVIKAEDKTVTLVSGRTRKTSSPKRKNVKHVKIIGKSVLSELAERINGTPVSDKRVRRLIESVEKQIRRKG